MNQEKIGKFIATVRKEKNLTQKDVAEHLNVSINAVSKWERGICLMDISLLKPLSLYLGVSVIEIINGEFLDDTSLKTKTDLAINSTLDYSQNSIKKQKEKIKYVVVYVFIAIFLVGFVCYKAVLCKMYETDINEERLQHYIDGLNNQDTMTIYKRTIDEDDYIQIKDVKIRNDFKDYERIDGENDLDGTQFLLLDGDIPIKRFSLGSWYTIVDIFTMDGIFFNTFNSEHYNEVQKSAFLKKNDIYNDIDFFQYVAKYKYKRNTLFTSVDEMKEKYAFNLFISVFSNDRLKKFTIINGDYTGYIMEAGKVIEANILRNNKRYTFLFAGDGLNDYEYVKDFLSTIEIK